MDYSIGDRIQITSGIHKGRSGTYYKHCSTAFKDWCRVKLDLKHRERTEKFIMLQKSDINHE